MHYSHDMSGDLEGPSRCMTNSLADDDFYPARDSGQQLICFIHLAIGEIRNLSNDNVFVSVHKPLHSHTISAEPSSAIHLCEMGVMRSTTICEE